MVGGLDLAGRWDVVALHDADGGEVDLAGRRPWLELDPADRTFTGYSGNHLSGAYRHRKDRWRARESQLLTTLMYVVDEPPLADGLLAVRLVEAEGADVLMLDSERRLVVRLTRR